jgi:ribose transport system permease protein
LKFLGSFLQRYGVLVAFVLLFAASAIWQPETFLKPENLRNLLSQNASIGIVAVGMTLVILAGGIDLSVGSMLALSAALGMEAMNRMILHGGAPESTAVLVAVAVSIGSGALLGAFNGLMVVGGRVAPFVATLVGLVAYRSLTLALAQASEIRSESKEIFPSLGSGGIPMPFLEVGGGRSLVIYWSILLFLAVAFFGSFLLNMTRFGRYAIAVGANEKAAQYSAVPVNRTKFLTYLLTGLFTGMAGLVWSTRMNSVSSPMLGMYNELDAIAAVVIGGTSLRGGSGRIWGTVVGVLLLGVITNMLQVAGVSVYWQGVVKGAIILVAVLIQRGRE